MQVKSGQIRLILLSWFVVLLMAPNGCSKEYQAVILIIEDFRFAPDQISLYSGQPSRLIIRICGGNYIDLRARWLIDPKCGKLDRRKSLLLTRWTEQ